MYRGATRTFSEPKTTDANVTHNKYVRLLPQPFDGTFGWVESGWLDDAEASNYPDLLQVAFDYVIDKPRTFDANGWLFKGDAHYGPASGSNGSLQPGSDFNDYQGRIYTYHDGTTDNPDPTRYASMDCSGFMRMVFGVRGGMEMTINPDGVRLPRTSYWMVDSAPGTMVEPDVGADKVVPPRAYMKLLPGDLFFWDQSTFNANPDTNKEIDHVGMYIGVDNAGHRRFISSRIGIDGPTMGDHPASDPTTITRSYVDGTGLYSKSFRAVRRL